MSRFPGFHDALRTWAFRLWDDMKTEVGSVRVIPPVGPRGGGDVVGAMRDPPTQSWPEHYGHAAFFLPEWQRVRDVWHSDLQLQTQYAQLVGAPGFKALVVEQEVGFAFWPTTRMAAHWCTGTDPAQVREEEFARIYGPVERFFGDEYRDVVFLVPLCGLVTDGPCELEAGTVLDRFTREEVQLLIDRGVLRGQLVGSITADNVDEIQRHGLRRVLRVGKYVGNEFTEAEAKEADRLLTQPVRDRLRILRAVGVCADGDVVPQPFVGRVAGWHPGGGERATVSSIGAFSAWGVQPVNLIKARHDELRHVWGLVGHPEFEGSGSLRIAVDRLAWRGTRSSAVDVLVDTAIASEAFFRSGEARQLARPKKGEESAAMRVKRRAGESADGSDFAMDANAVRTFFHEAYELRNGIVHRGEHPESIVIGPQALALPAFVARYVALVRRALLRHFMSQTKPCSPVWNDIPEAGSVST